eukprot:6500729-Pyramimonas_sp.AAC.1
MPHLVSGAHALAHVADEVLLRHVAVYTQRENQSQRGRWYIPKRTWWGAPMRSHTWQTSNCGAVPTTILLLHCYFTVTSLLLHCYFTVTSLRCRTTILLLHFFTG